MASLMPQGKQVYSDNAGAPLAGGRLYTYAAGTTTPLATYSDQAGTVPNANPVVLDARGEATVFWAASAYKAELRSAADAVIWTQDNIYPDATLADIAALAPIASPAFTGVPTGLGPATVTATGSTVPRSLAAREADVVNVKDYGATGDGATDDTTALRTVATAADGRNVTILFPPGSYRTKFMTFSTGKVRLQGNGAKIVQIYDSAADTGGGTTRVSPFVLIKSAASQVEVTGFEFTQDAATFPSLPGYESYLAPVVAHRASHISVHHNRFDLSVSGRGLFNYGSSVVDYSYNTGNAGTISHIGYVSNAASGTRPPTRPRTTRRTRSRSSATRSRTHPLARHRLLLVGCAGLCHSRQPDPRAEYGGLRGYPSVRERCRPHGPGWRSRALHEGHHRREHYPVRRCQHRDPGARPGFGRAL